MKSECFLPLRRPKATARQHSSRMSAGDRYIAVRSCKLKHLPSPIKSSQSGQQGFTLIELVVTVALVAILATLAFPDFSETVRQWRRDSATRALTTSLQLARAEAIKSSRKLMLCPSTNGTSCANSTEWRNGWIVFVDDGATDQAFDAGERIVQVTSAQGGVATMTSSAGVTFLQFLPNGLMAAGATAGATTGTTTLTVTPSGSTSATKVNRVSVSRVGRANVVTELP
jgi:type IV fimbrial biogenesis protein FimT